MGFLFAVFTISNNEWAGLVFFGVALARLGPCFLRKLERSPVDSKLYLTGPVTRYGRVSWAVGYATIIAASLLRFSSICYKAFWE
jgi:hypothetical protein